MGRRIPMDKAMEMAALKKDNESIIIENNKYGFKININHPEIRPLYEAYHSKIGVPLAIGLTTAQRHNFESIIFKMLEERRSKTVSNEPAEVKV